MKKETAKIISEAHQRIIRRKGKEYSPTPQEIEIEINNSLNQNNMNTFEKIRHWATERQIFLNATPEKQFLKLMEEIGELSQGMQKKDQEEIKDAIGDCIVVLTILSSMYNINIEECIDSAYSVIEKRTGKMVNGVFVKDK